MAKRKRKQNRFINRRPLFKVGDVVSHPNYDVGVIRKIDSAMFPDYEFFYYADFTGKGGDGTKVWLPKVQAEKTMRLVSRDGKPWDNTPACEGTNAKCPATCWGVQDCPLCKRQPS